MIVLWLDTETTGLNVQTDEVIEFGHVLHSTGQGRMLEAGSRLVKATRPITQEITDLTGVYPNAVEKFGYESDDTLDYVIELASMADALGGHNVKRFDKRIIEAWSKRLGRKFPEKLWIDSFTDLPMVGEGLITMMAKRGILLDGAHSALFDAYGSLRLTMTFDFDTVVTRAQSPDILVIAHHSRDENEKAKKLKFRWNPENKIWWKAMKETDVETFSKTCPFDISVADKSMSLEQLQDS